jgi:hypothetical protein
MFTGTPTPPFTHKRSTKIRKKAFCSSLVTGSVFMTNADSDPAKLNECESGSETSRMCTTETTYHLFDLHASLELHPLSVHHHVDLPGSVLKCSPANQFNLRTEDLVAKEEKGLPNCQLFLPLHDLPMAFTRGKMQFRFLDRFVRVCFTFVKSFVNLKKPKNNLTWLSSNAECDAYFKAIGTKIKNSWGFVN